MSKSRTLFFGFLLSTFAAFNPLVPALAGPYTDQMSVCLVDNTTNVEKFVLIRWLVSAFSRHPKVTDIFELNEAAVEANSKLVADLFEQLILVRCKSETTVAIKNEGNYAMEQAFGVLGQVAAREVFENESTTKYLMDFMKYLDEDGFADVFK